MYLGFLGVLVSEFFVVSNLGTVSWNPSTFGAL